MNALISGRFAAPRTRRSLLRRERLLDRLHGAIGIGVTVLHAPAGWGKTSLLASFVSELDFNVRWLTLDGSSASASVFARQLAIAIGGEAGDQDLAIAERLDDLRAYIAHTLERTVSESEQPLLIVIDNVHELAEAEEASEILGWLLDTLTESSEVVLSGREVPPVALVEALIATGDCVMLGSGDLAFNASELSRLAPLESDLRIRRILKATGGWPAAVMATLSGTIKLSDGAARPDAAWGTYIGSQVWSAVPERLRASFLQLALPQTLTERTAIEAVGRQTWREVEAWTDRHDFLVEPSTGGGLRWNPLFRQFLLRTFEESAADEFAGQVRKMAERLEASGELSEAFEIVRDAGLDDELTAMVARHGRELLNGGQFALLRRALDGLRTEVAEQDAETRAIRARVLAHTGGLSEALTEAGTILGEPFAPVQAQIDALLAQHRAYRLLGRTDELGELFDRLEPLANLASPILRAEIAYHRAQWVLPTSSDFAEADRLLRESLAASTEAGSGTLELLARSTLGQLLAMRGEAPEAVSELARAARGWRERGGTANLGWVLNNLGMAHVDCGDFESAVPTLKEAITEAQICENERNLAYATASLAEAEFALGHFDESRINFEEAIRICSEEVPDETLASLSISGLAATFLGLDDVQQADYFSVRALHIAESVGTEFETGKCLVTHAAVQAAAGKHAEAAELAERAVSLFTKMDARAPLRTAYYRLAMGHFTARKRAEAGRVLDLLGPLLTEPWTVGVLIPMVREAPMFAQWSGARNVLGQAFALIVQQHAFAGVAVAEPAAAVTLYPPVEVESLGRLHVTVGGRAVTEESWASVKSKELFFLFLANRDGLRKEEAVEQLYPEIDPDKCNSAFHSNLYRVRRALFQESVIRRDGAYMLNPAGSFSWDVERFQGLLQEATEMPQGSDERAALHRRALEIYRGPFAEAFYSEWAESVRQRTEERAQEAMATLAGFYAGRNNFEAAAHCMEDLLARNSANQEAAFQLARYRLQAGQPALALSFIDQYAVQVEREYGERLPARFTELRQRIASGQAV